MKLNANERIELENAVNTLARIEMRVVEERRAPGIGSPPHYYLVDIARAREAIKGLLGEAE